MDEEGLKLFKNLVKNSHNYLEFGCGGSTNYVLKNTDATTVTSVDSDNIWIDDVLNSLNESEKERLLIRYCDIGPVGAWGVPKNKSNFENWWRYMTTPWELAHTNSIKPDLVLVDGRFRVASFLYSLLAAQDGITILFDDYLERPEYFVVEKYCNLTGKAGRMGIFTVTKNFSTSEISAAIAQYSVIPD